MKRKVFWLVFIISLVSASPAWAVQAHGAPEGLYIHQFAHVFFAAAMGIFMYWLKASALTTQPGWRMIRYCALFLLLWNIDAFAAHFLDENLAIVSFERNGLLHMNLSSETQGPFLPALYYFLKMDHLWCVPGMVFLYLGLRRILADQQAKE
ncbi:hypothetical protein SAMN02745216_03642 [Desulfatibacillum alkenivorans DSM 16219]|jgi:hypothetical protein|uniref:Uncharacterized protein n=1 Tax=Desulfatibacillum alkenivorans DSM 16219 TaxID=1121393 RepID=A0A1M6TDH9_9BACT|nr:hypothetical protein [Desulfatibacillum alkenivorans]SHK54939.1 hypothetical protein SAMN02745216_03642 [Desulfatibacillum alkenivorans DSM 16219]